MAIKLIKVAKEYNRGLHTIVETLRAYGFTVEPKPTADITDEMLNILKKEFESDLTRRQTNEEFKKPEIIRNSINNKEKRNPNIDTEESISRTYKIHSNLNILSDLKLAAEIILKCKQEKSLFLDLGNCGLYSIPEEIFQFEWLEGLNFSSEFKNPETGKFQASRNHQSNNILIADNLNGLIKLKNLKYLNLSNCRLNNTLSLTKLTSLTELWLDSLGLTSRSIYGLSNLSNLKTLSLKQNLLTDIADIAGLNKLHYLDLGNNEIQDIQVLSGLTNLVELNLTDNKISDLRSLYSLKKLKILNIGGNSIEDIFALSRLTQLERLDASGNKINKIIILRDLPGLINIHLDANPIEDCPVEFWKRNDIRQIRAYFDLKSRQEEDDEQSQNEEITQNNEIKLILVGNCGVGKTQLANLLVSGRYKDTRDSTHGITVSRWNPNSKSSEPFQVLPKRFLVNIWDFGGQEYYHGTHQLFMSNQAVYVLLWDKSSNLNGVKLTEIGTEKSEKVAHFHYRYWLESIRHYAPESPIIIVQNKIDDPEQSKERLKNEDLELFGVELDGLTLSLRNAVKGDGIYQRMYLKFAEELAEQLGRTAKSFAFNRAWINIRNAIQDLNEDKENTFSKGLIDQSWMKIEKFEELCLEIEPDLTKDELYTLPNWLNNIGSLLYYPNNLLLKDRVFLNPQWITENIYKILNKTVYKNNGEFSLVNLSEDVKPFASTFIAMMIEMEIIFPHPIETDRFIAPQYLPEGHVIEDLYAIAELGLRQSSYRIQVPLFFYRKLMHRLILYFGMEADVNAKYYWKHGIVFVTKGETRCLIKGLYLEENQQEGVILIGIEKTSELLNLQREIFQRILIILSNREVELGMKIHPPTLGVKSQIAMPEFDDESDPEEIADFEFYNNPFSQGWTEKYLRGDIDTPRWLSVLEVAVGDSNFVSYLKLCNAAKMGLTKIVMKDGSVELVKNFDYLLDRNTPQPLKVFLSYSHNDLQLMRRLDVHLAPLKRIEKIESWNDRDILPGLDWDSTIRKQLNEADIILLLITADFVASEYIWEKELKFALEKMKQGKCRLIPILLQPVDFSELPFAETQMIPSEEKGRGDLLPITLWTNPEEGFAIVAKEIRRVINEMAGGAIFVPDLEDVV